MQCNSSSGEDGLNEAALVGDRTQEGPIVKYHEYFTLEGTEGQIDRVGSSRSTLVNSKVHSKYYLLYTDSGQSFTLSAFSLSAAAFVSFHFLLTTLNNYRPITFRLLLTL